MTLAEDIIGRAAGGVEVTPGDLVTVTVDRVYLQDGNTPTVRRLFREHGFTRVFDPDRVGVFFDHAVLAPDAAMADRLREAREFADEMGLAVFPAGRGISHVVAMEERWFEPGTIVVGADSHTCTGGVVQCLALGMGASDVTAAMVTGKTWLRVPETAWIHVQGTPSAAARPKDVALYALARFGQAPFLYRSVHWHGDWLAGLSPDGAATIANMGVECGAKCAFLPPGPGREEGLVPLEPSSDAPPEHLHTLDVSGLPPFVARPHLPTNAVPLDDCSGEPVDYVFIGSCTNGRYEDLREVATVLRGRRVATGTQCVVTPGSHDVFTRLLAEGHVSALVEAGVLVTPPGCGSCVGTQGPIPAAGDRVLTTTNRNFRGRMGNPEAAISLASPLVAAHAAVEGRLPSTEEVSDSAR
jgi:3-isopropylmalate/(R)-2-methylmalate dehydratase large subunit